MSESNLTIFDGPEKFSDQEFCDFLKIISELKDQPSSGFDDMCHIWLDQNYPHHIRILCLRNVLRQTDSRKSNSPAPYNNCEINFGRLIHVLNDKGALDLFLKYSPRVHNELYQELLYNLDHGFRDALRHSYQLDDLDQLIYMLLPQSSPANGLRLWHYHSIALNLPHELEQALKLCERKTTPNWLRDQLFTEIGGIIEAEFCKHQDFYQREQKIYMYSLDASEVGRGESTDNLLYPVSDHIGVRAHYFLNPGKSRVSFDFSDFSLRLIEELEKHLPLPVAYVDKYHVTDALNLIKAPDILYSFARRHVPLLRREKYKIEYHMHLITFCYLRDFVSHFAPSDYILLAELDDLINAYNLKAK